MRESTAAERKNRAKKKKNSETVRVRVSECGRKIRNANRMPKSDDRTESNLRRGRREGGRERRWEEVGGRQGGGEGRREEEGGGGLRPEKSGVRICTGWKETLLSQE